MGPIRNFCTRPIRQPVVWPYASGTYSKMRAIRGRILANGVAVDLGLEVFTGGFHAGDLAEEGYLLFAVGQLGHAAFGQTDLAHEAHVQQSGEQFGGIALLFRRGRA